MTRIGLATLALACAFAASIAAPAFAQDDSKTKALGYTAASKQEAAAAKQQSAASLLEQAAYAEEHERDFKKAAVLYAKALQAAQDVGDAALTKKATAGVDRLAKLAGGYVSTAPSQLAPAPTARDPVQARIADLMSNASTGMNSDVREKAKADLALFGEVAAPFLRDACTHEVVVADQVIRMDTATFIEVLCRMQGGPVVDGAIRQLSTSPDPWTRREITTRVDLKRYTELLISVTTDPVEDVRRAAIRRLSGSDDLRVAPLMSSAAAQGDQNAIWWLIWRDPKKLFAILDDTATSRDVRDQIFKLLVDRRPSLAPDESSVDALLRLGRSSDAVTARAAVATLVKCVSEQAWRAKPPEFFARIESALGSDLAKYPVPEVWNLELAVGSANALEPLMKSLVPQIRVLDQSGYNQLATTIQTRLSQETALEVPALVSAFGAIPISTATASDTAGYLGLLSQNFSGLLGRGDRLRWNDVDAGAFMKALMALDDAHWDALQRATYDWLVELYGRYDRATAEPVRISESLGSLLRRSLHKTSGVLPAQAAFVLSRTRDLAFLPDLLAVPRTNDGSYTSVSNAIVRLIGSDRVAAAKPLEKEIDGALARSDPSVDRLIEWIGQLDAKDAIALVTKYTAQLHDDQQRQALFGLMVGVVQTPESTSFLLTNYARLNSDLRAGAVNRFGTELYEPAIPVLGDALKDKDLSVREAARTAFKRFREQREALDEYDAWMKADKDAKQTADELIKLLASPNAAVVTSAVKTLGALKVRSAYPAIIKLLDRNDAAISAAVKEAIDKLAQ